MAAPWPAASRAARLTNPKRNERSESSTAHHLTFIYRGVPLWAQMAVRLALLKRGK